LTRIDLNGGNPFEYKTEIGGENPDISPDGKWVIYSAWKDGKQHIFRVPIGGGDPEILTNYVSTEPRYSPDGSTFACFIISEKSQQLNRLAIVRADGGDPVQTFDVPTTTDVRRGPIWTPDGRGITIIVSPGEQQNLWLQPISGGPLKQMTNFDLPGVARRDYSRDGKQIAIVRAEGFSNAVMITGFR
jgi:Tol biopolymer transport system component